MDRTVAYLQRAQNRDGGFGGRPGGASDPIFSAWVGIGLAAAGINPQDQVQRRGSTDLYTYLVRHADDLEVTTDFERAMLVAVAAGADPTRFGGRNLVASILSRQLPDGSFPHEAGGRAGGINDTAFAILPLSVRRGQPARQAIHRAARWLLSVQSPDGSWGFAPGIGSSSDMTAAVIQALRAAGIHESDAEKRGWEYIRRTQVPGGGFGERPGGTEANTASTAWVVQAMWAAGVAPETWRAKDGDPLFYLASMQAPDGSIRWKESVDLNPIWMTAYAAPAFAGHPLPVPPVPRSGEHESSGEAGGGGGGAPLFSRPQPQSHGNAAGGIHELGRRDPEQETKSRDPARSNPEQDVPLSSQSSGGGQPGVTAVPSDPGETRTGESGGASGPRTFPPPRDWPGDVENTHPDVVHGHVIDADAITEGQDGSGDRHATAPGLAGSLDDPGNESVLLIGMSLLTVAGLGAWTDIRSHRRRLSSQHR